MKRVICFVACLAGVSVYSNAASLFHPVEVSDAQLAELRGRYVLPDRIIHFGVTLSSFWQNSEGQRVGANVGFQVDGQSRPNLYVTTLDTAVTPTNNGEASAGSGQVIGGAGLGEVHGISQSVRSAGDFNDGLNNVEIVVSRGAQVLTPVEGEALSGGALEHAAQAGSVSVSALDGGIQLQIDAGSQGMALQRIGAGSIIQQANFTGDLNTVRNQATLNVALRDLAMGQDFANCTMEQLRALRPGGY